MTQPNRTAQLLESISRTSIGIIGDFCLDAYWDLDRGTPELSLETGKPTFAVTNQRYSPGGAGNVTQNLIALGVRRVAVFGVVGNDLFGMELQRQMAELGVANGLSVQSTDWQTPVYAKPYNGSEEQSRIDFGRFNVLSTDSERTRKPVYITRSRRGILLFDGTTATQIHAAEIAGPADPVGAGDTVVATLAASLAARSGLKESAELAALAATVTVKKLRQTGTASPSEILATAAAATPAA